MTGSSSAVNRDEPRMSPRPTPRKGSHRHKEKAAERKDTDSHSIGSDSRSRSGSLSSVDSSDQLQEGRSKFEKVCSLGTYCIISFKQTIFVFSVLNWSWLAVEVRAGQCFYVQIFLMIFPGMSLNCRLQCSSVSIPRIQMP